jgi:hypothetical protein
MAAIVISNQAPMTPAQYRVLVICCRQGGFVAAGKGEHAGRVERVDASPIRALIRRGFLVNCYGPEGGFAGRLSPSSLARLTDLRETRARLAARQRLLFIRFEARQPGYPCARAIPVHVPWSEREVKSVWSLLLHRDEAEEPALPFYPVHGRNAFIEDISHDWNIHNGMFRYASRATDQPLWVLIELA